MAPWKLEDLLRRRCIYMTHVERLGDDHEGTMPAVTKATADFYSRECDPRSLTAATYPALRNRKWYYTTSWTIREAECEALWRLYSDGQDRRQCVAVESTYSRLISPFDGGTCIAGLVQYIDYNQFDDREVRDWQLLFLKRRAFDYEQEVRVIARRIKFAPEQQHVEIKPGSVFLTDEWWKSLYEQPPAIDVPVDPSQLITNVYVSPYADAAVFERVGQWLREAGLQIAPKWSTMRETPLIG
jgi:hypothetical protein